MTRGASVQVREATDQASPGRETDLRADAASPRAAAGGPPAHTRVAERVDFETRVCTTDGASDRASAIAVPNRDQWFMNGPRLAA